MADIGLRPRGASTGSHVPDNTTGCLSSFARNYLTFTEVSSFEHENLRLYGELATSTTSNITNILKLINNEQPININSCLLNNMIIRGNHQLKDVQFSDFTRIVFVETQERAHYLDY